MKTNSHIKNYARILAFIMRLKATGKWPIKNAFKPVSIAIRGFSAYSAHPSENAMYLVLTNALTRGPHQSLKKNKQKFVVK